MASSLMRPKSSLMPPFNSLLGRNKFPVPMRRELPRKVLILLRGHRRDFLPHTRAKKLPRAAEYLVYSLTPSGVLAENHPKNRGFVGILRGQKCPRKGQKCPRRGQKCLERRFSR